MRVALAGAGFMGETHAGCYQQIEDVEVAAVVDVRPDQREKLAHECGAEPFADLEPVLADASIDVVDCCLPTPLHHDCVVQAFDAGKHVLCEKPFAVSVEQCDRMIAAARRAGRTFMIAQVVRFWPEYVTTKHIVASGRLGEIQAMTAHRLAPPPKWSQDDWLLKPDKSLGAVVDLQIHDLDFLRYCLGDPVSLTAAGLHSATGSVDYVFTTLHYENHLAFTEASFLMPPHWPFRAALRLVGTEATLELDLSREPTLWVTDSNGEISVPDVPAEDGYLAEIKYFCSAVRDGLPVEVAPPEDSRESLRLALCSKQAVESGGVVPF